jgi:hypothetical protein
MRSRSPALDLVLATAKDLATNAREMWSLDTGQWQVRERDRARTGRSAPMRKITLDVRLDDWRTWLRKGAFVCGVAVIVVAVGLALRGKVPTAVGSAAAATSARPSVAVTPTSTITVTPIDEPMVSRITVTPIEEPAPPVTSHDHHTSKHRRRAKGRKARIASKAKGHR